MKCSFEEMRRSAMAAVRAVRSERDKEFQRRQENITGPKSLKRGIHMHQIRTKPAYGEQMVNQFIQENEPGLAHFPYPSDQYPNDIQRHVCIHHRPDLKIPTMRGHYGHYRI